jgi:hypothetical protein
VSVVARACQAGRTWNGWCAEIRSRSMDQQRGSEGWDSFNSSSQCGGHEALPTASVQNRDVELEVTEHGDAQMLGSLGARGGRRRCVNVYCPRRQAHADAASARARPKRVALVQGHHLQTRRRISTSTTPPRRPVLTSSRSPAGDEPLHGCTWRPQNASLSSCKHCLPPSRSVRHG